MKIRDKGLNEKEQVRIYAIGVDNVYRKFHISIMSMYEVIILYTHIEITLCMSTKKNHSY